MQSIRTCDIDGCERPAKARGWCKMHWQRWSRYGDTKKPADQRPRWEARFWSKVDRSLPEGCWEWNAPTSHGYGRFSRGGRGAGMVAAHRVSWEIANGPIPAGMLVRHKCDNPPCVNPTHLELGTQLENMRDMAQRERGSHTALTAIEVEGIRTRVSNGEARSAIAAEFGVSKSNIDMIVRGQTWRHVDRRED